MQIAQALVAGNAVLWKPSENVPRTAELTHALFLEAGFPRELFQMLPATREAGPQLAEADVDHVVFTGSDAVGRKLAARLGERLVPSTLELSGCDAMFVLADADVEMAAQAAWFGVTLNRGQTCIAVRRIFVQRAKLDAFADALRKLAANAAADGAGDAEAQATQAERLIEDAVERGATSPRRSPCPSERRQSRLPAGRASHRFPHLPPRHSARCRDLPRGVLRAGRGGDPVRHDRRRGVTGEAVAVRAGRVDLHRGHRRRRRNWPRASPPGSVIDQRRARADGAPGDAVRRSRGERLGRDAGRGGVARR